MKVAVKSAMTNAMTVWKNLYPNGGTFIIAAVLFCMATTGVLMSVFLIVKGYTLPKIIISIAGMVVVCLLSAFNPAPGKGQVHNDTTF
jgi:hypothetical protein